VPMLGCCMRTRHVDIRTVCRRLAVSHRKERCNA
jgi:hypothetical protein